MSHRGKNPNPNTAQIWNGSRWVPYSPLSFESNVTTVPSSLWVDSSFGFGHTKSVDFKNNLSHEYSGTITDPVFASQKLHLQDFGICDGTDPKTFVLPASVLGVENLPSGGPMSLVAEFLLTVAQDSGSIIVAMRYIALWKPVYGGLVGEWTDKGVSPLGGIATGSSFTVETGVDVNSAPTLILNCASLGSDTITYMLDLDLKLLGFRP